MKPRIDVNCSDLKPRPDRTWCEAEGWAGMKCAAMSCGGAEMCLGVMCAEAENWAGLNWNVMKPRTDLTWLETYCGEAETCFGVAWTVVKPRNGLG